jgi:peptidoglycan-N-acetylglucosamine deacetylase
VARTLRRRSVIRHGSRREREVALTFDDGPSPYTPRIVRILRRARAGGTFFPVGVVLPRWPKAFARVRDAGFVIGDHTVNHRALAQLPVRAQRREIRGEARRLRGRGVPWPRLFRPPYGSFDRRTLGVTRRLGMLAVLWSIDSQDYIRPGVRTIVRRVVSHVHPGSIVLMHDGGGRRDQTVAALPRIIRVLRRRGYRLVTVPDLLTPGRA